MVALEGAWWFTCCKALIRTAAVVVECLIITILILATLELLSRVVHLGVRPMLPYIADEAQGSRMPASFDSNVRFLGSPAFRVCTDEYGLRKSSCSTGVESTTVLTVGDSQAFGWAMPFEDTFTAHVAKALGEDAEHNARAMAAGGTDVESLLAWAKDYRSQAPLTRPRLNIIVINFGNDFDEMYFGRSTGRVPFMKAVREWLTVHSFFMLDFNLVKNAWFTISDWQLPPGANPVVLTLRPKERERLAIATSDAAVRLVRALPEAQKSVVVLLPTDYQVAKGEFTKYRKFYSTQAQFDGWNKRVDEAAAALNEIEQIIAHRLQSKGLSVVAPRTLLATHDPGALFDRSSHHYTSYGQRVLSQAILQKAHLGAGL